MSLDQRKNSKIHINIKGIVFSDLFDESLERNREDKNYMLRNSILHYLHKYKELLRIFLRICILRELLT